MRSSGMFRNVAAVAIFVLMIGVAATAAPEAHFAYVTNEFSNTVSVIDTDSHAVVATIPVPDGPTAIAITPDGAFAYVACWYGPVSVIDTETNTVVAEIATDYGWHKGIAIAPEGGRAYVANFYDKKVSVIDTSTRSVVATVSLDAEPTELAVTPDGSWLYVVNGGYGNAVSVIDTATNAVVRTIPVYMPYGIAMAPDGRFAYVTFYYNVAVIEIATNTVTQVGAGSTAYGIAITPDGAFAYVTNYFSYGLVNVLDTGTGSIVATVNVGPNPTSVAFTPNGAFAYVVSPVADSVDIVDTATKSVIATVPVGDLPTDVAMIPEHDLGLDDRVRALIDLVEGLNLSEGTSGSLIAKLDRVLLGLQDETYRPTACTMLSAFINQAESTVPDPAAVVEAAEEIMSELGCE